MRMKGSSVTLLGGALLLFCSAGWAVNFLTEGVDNGRTGWLQGDKSFTLQNVKGMKLLWKTKLDSTPREMHNLFAPLLLPALRTTFSAWMQRPVTSFGMCTTTPPSRRFREHAVEEPCVQEDRLRFQWLRLAINQVSLPSMP